MRTLEYAKDVRPMALLEALQQAGLPAAGVRPPAGPGAPAAVVLDVAPDDTSQDAATDAVVAAHSPQAIDAKAQELQAAYDDAVAFLKVFRKQTPGTATNAQRDHALHALIDVSKKLNADLRESGEG